MATDKAQEILFKRIKSLLPHHISMVDAVSEILHVSTDSAYRRIRGETPLVLDEAVLLCSHFKLSLDQLMSLKKGGLIFRDIRIKGTGYSYQQYLKDLSDQIEAVNDFLHKEIIYMSKDLPLFHNFYFRPLIAFRYYFWMKNHLMHPEFEKKKFSFDLLSDEIEHSSYGLAKAYGNIPSTEMWNIESLNSTLSQIEFVKDSGHFGSIGDLKKIYETLEDTIRHMMDQAEYGCKFMPGEDPAAKKSNFRFLYNRIVLGDNTVLAITDFMKTAFINYGGLNYLSTNDESFCNDLYNDFENLIPKSTQISKTGEKQRNIFFGILLSKIQDRKRNL